MLKYELKIKLYMKEFERRVSMDLYVLNESLETVDVIDSFKSLIWIERYSEYGDFELYLNANKDNIRKLKMNYYLWRQDSTYLMIIEEIKTEADAENGNYLTVSGRSLESLLLRRICWSTVVLDGYLPGQVKKIFDQNIISPTDPKRKFPNFIYEIPSDERITNLKIQMQFTGETVYDAIKKICDKFKFGFRILLNNQNKFAFQIYMGIDRSYAQNKNPYVVFSPNFDNIINSEYYHSTLNVSNLALVAGEGEGSDRKTLVVGNTENSGFYRRELYVDARDLSETDSDGNQLGTDAYNALLSQRGNEKLSEYKEEKRFDDQVETTQMYRYGEHFFMGDIVQIENEYNMEAKTRIIEYVRSESDSGIESYPTFEILENEVT